MFRTPNWPFYDIINDWIAIIEILKYFSSQNEMDALHFALDIECLKMMMLAISKGGQKKTEFNPQSLLM